MHAKLEWNVAQGACGVLPDVSQEQATHNKHPDVLYELSVRLGEKTVAEEVEAWGSPDHVIHCSFHDDSSDTDAAAFERAKKSTFNDEFGSATAGGGGGGGGRRGLGEEHEQKEIEFPAEGGLFLDFRRDLDPNADNKKRKFELEFPTYKVDKLLQMEEGASAVCSMRSQMDDRYGPVTLLVRVTRLARSGGQPYLRLDAIDALFGQGYWDKKLSLTRKMRVATSGAMRKAEGSSVHRCALP